MRPEQQSSGFQQHPAQINGFSKPCILPLIAGKENIKVHPKGNWPNGAARL
jgi:hypothetical protein